MQLAMPAIAARINAAARKNTAGAIVMAFPFVVVGGLSAASCHFSEQRRKLFTYVGMNGGLW